MIYHSLKNGLLACLCMMPGLTAVAAPTQVDFSDVPLASPPTQSYGGPGGGVYYNGSDGAGGYTSGGVFFPNAYVDFGGGFFAWQGWAYSTTTDVATAGFGNQHSAYSGGAYMGSAYGVSYVPQDGTSLTLPTGYGQPVSVRITNTTYAALDMLNGSGFSKKFGGASGDDPDWLLLTLTGRDSADAVTGSLDFYLADFRFSDNSLNYIIDDWTELDLSPLGLNLEKIHFTMSSSDMGDFGMNTPAYFAMDGLVLVPELAAVFWLLALLPAALGIRLHRVRAAKS